MTESVRQRGQAPVSRYFGSRWVRGLREIGIVLAIYVAYSAVRSLSGDEAVRAISSAEDILRWQERWSLDWEAGIQSWTLDRDPLVHVANFVYFWFHLPFLALFAVWMFWTDEETFRFLRWVWIITQIIGIAFYYFYPVAPPRLMPPGFGFEDTLAEHSSVNYGGAEAGVLMNKYAAFPSLHFAWSFIIGAGLLATVPSPWNRAAVVLFPLASLWSIIATGNHWVADALSGGVLAASAFALAAGVRHVARSRASQSPATG